MRREQNSRIPSASSGQALRCASRIVGMTKLLSSLWNGKLEKRVTTTENEEQASERLWVNREGAGYNRVRKKFLGEIWTAGRRRCWWVRLGWQRFYSSRKKPWRG